MWRRRCNLLTAVSLLLCLATAVLWARSFARRDTIFSTTGARRFVQLDSKPAGLAVLTAAGWPTDEPLTWHTCRPEARQGFLLTSGAPVTQYWRRLGAAYFADGQLAVLHDRAGSPVWQFPGVMPFSPGHTRLSGAVWSVTVPHWAVTMVAGAPGLAVLSVRVQRRHREKRRAGRRLCRGCGYDLRGNVSGACPECGLAADTAV